MADIDTIFEKIEKKYDVEKTGLVIFRRDTFILKVEQNYYIVFVVETDNKKPFGSSFYYEAWDVKHGWLLKANEFIYEKIKEELPILQYSDFQNGKVDLFQEWILRQKIDKEINNLLSTSSLTFSEFTQYQIDLKNLKKLRPTTLQYLYDWFKEEKKWRIL